MHEGQYDEAVRLCERLTELSSVSDEDSMQLSLSRIIASAAAALPDICCDNRRPLVSYPDHAVLISSLPDYVDGVDLKCLNHN